MEYKLFEEFITLQALLKELGITHSGGAIKSFLSDILFTLMGNQRVVVVKNFVLAIKVDIPDMNIDILLTQPTSEEQDEYQADKVEKETDC